MRVFDQGYVYKSRSKSDEEDDLDLDSDILRPEDLKKDEMIAVDNVEQEFLNLQVQLAKNPKMKPTELEIKRALEKQTTY